MFNFKINIADVVIEFESRDSKIKYVASDMKELIGMKGFLYRGKKEADIRLRIKRARPPKFSKKKIIFKAKNNWRLSRWNSKFLYEYPIIKQSIIFDSDMSEATIYEERFLNNTYFISAKGIISEIKGNFLQALLIEYLPRKRRSVLAHSACVQDNDRVYLFMGKTRSGKSTMARLWNNEKGVRVFNDDRVILSLKNKGCYFYNTPWRGDFYRGYQMPQFKDKARIDKIFFICQEKDNTVKRLSKNEAAQRILRNIFPPFWNEKAMEYALKLSFEIAGATPCYNLGFVNGERIVDFVRNLK